MNKANDIVVVDDNPALLRVLSDIFEAHGHTVSLANGKAAIARACIAEGWVCNIHKPTLYGALRGPPHKNAARAAYGNTPRQSGL